MDWQPDTDIVESRVRAQPEEETDEEEVRPDDQVISEPGPPAPRPGPEPPGATLGAFFRMLGAILVASRPDPPASEDTRPSPQVARKNVKQALQGLKESQIGQDHGPRHRYLHIVAPAALVAVVVSILTLSPGTPESLSPQLMGSWETSAGKYADRTLQLSDSEIVFEQGRKNGFASYPITHVTSRRNADGALIYVVTYDNAGVAHQFSFIHQPVANTITLKNQPQVTWQKIRNEKSETSPEFPISNF